MRAAIAANALGNVAEHSPPPPPPPRRKGKGRGGRRLPSRAMRVAADDEQERDGDKSFVEALVFVLRLAPPRYAQPPFREALAELKTSATWCLASLCAHDGPRQGRRPVGDSAGGDQCMNQIVAPNSLIDLRTGRAPRRR